MREFFRGWKRKIGCVTLGMACVFTAAWLRSEFVSDILIRSIGDRTLISGFSRCGTCKLGLTQNEIVDLEGFEWTSNSIAPFVRDSGLRNYSRYDVRWIYRFGRFEIARIQESKGSGPIWTFVEASYLSMIIPLTVVSAWLLLSKPRSAKSISASEPQAMRG